MTAVDDDRRGKLEERERWLEASVASLQKSFNRSPLLAILYALVVPAWFVGKGLGVFYVAFMVSILVGVWVYIAWGHLHEHEIELKAVRTELRQLRAKAAKAAQAAQAAQEA